MLVVSLTVTVSSWKVADLIIIVNLQSWNYYWQGPEAPADLGSRSRNYNNMYKPTFETGDFETSSDDDSDSDDWYSRIKK